MRKSRKNDKEYKEKLTKLLKEYKDTFIQNYKDFKGVLIYICNHQIELEFNAQLIK